MSKVVSEYYDRQVINEWGRRERPYRRLEFSGVFLQGPMSHVIQKADRLQTK